MWARGRWLFVGALLLLLAACGGEEKAAPRPTLALPTAEVIVSSVTPVALVPTWTPEPTLTPVIRTPLPSLTPRPTRTPFVPLTATPRPTRTPTLMPTAETEASSPEPAGLDVPATLAGPNPTLIVTAEELNARLAADASALLRRAFARTPAIDLAEGKLVLRGALLTTSGTALVERPMMVRADITLLNGQPMLVPFEALYMDDTSPYTGDLAPFLNPAQQFLTDAIRAIYLAQRPGDVGYFIAAIRVGEGQMVIETVSLTG